MSPAGVPPAEALAALAFLLGWHRSSLPFFADGERAGNVDTRPIPDRILRKLKIHGEDHELAIGIDDAPDNSILWAWVRGSEQTRLARRFRPVPSIVLKMGTGSERLCIWPLTDPLPNPQIEIANRRLGYALRTGYTRAEVYGLRVPLPGSLLRVGRRRPVPVIPTRLLEATYTANEVVGQLLNPPPADAWKARKS